MVRCISSVFDKRLPIPEIRPINFLVDPRPHQVTQNPTTDGLVNDCWIYRKYAAMDNAESFSLDQRSQSPHFDRWTMQDWDGGTSNPEFCFFLKHWYQTLNSQKTSHILPSRASYGVPFISIFSRKFTMPWHKTLHTSTMSITQQLRCIHPIICYHGDNTSVWCYITVPYSTIYCIQQGTMI